MAEDHSPNYQKLASGRFTIGSTQSLYLADDHFLVIDGTYKQRYRRLYLKDIQGLLAHPTEKSLYINIVLGAILGILALSALVGIDSGSWYISVSIAIPFVLMLFYNLYQQGSVQLGLFTAVQCVPINCVSSKRKAEKLKARIIETIQSAQGTLTDAELQAVRERDKIQYKQVSTPTEIPQQEPPPVTPETPTPPR